METLLDKAASEGIKARLGRLQSTSKPLWGKMNVSQMLAHCQPSMEIALGDRKAKRNFFGFLFGKMVKKKMIGDKPFSKNLPTDKSFLVNDPRNFEEERIKLTRLVNRFTDAGKQGITKDPHPFFGRMTPEEWGTLSWKHLDHHLTQFGV